MVLLQLAKAADKVSDAAQLSGDLNDVKAVTDIEKAEDDPGADAIRGALSLRRFSRIRGPSVSSRVFSEEGVPPIHLSHRSTWRGRRDTMQSNRTRQSTIRVVTPEEEEEQRKSSVQFDPSAPVTRIYPAKDTTTTATSTENQLLRDRTEEDSSPSKRYHNPLSPVMPPDFISAPPTPRYAIPERSILHKQFSFGRTGKTMPTEEETMGLVQAEEREQAVSDDIDDGQVYRSPSQRSEGSDFENVERTPQKKKQRSYDMF